MKEEVIELIQYCAFDGKIFNTPDDCIDHEIRSIYRTMCNEGRANEQIDHTVWIKGMGYVSIFIVKSDDEISVVKYMIENCGLVFDDLINYNNIKYPTHIIWNDGAALIDVHDIINNLTIIQNESKI